MSVHPEALPCLLNIATAMVHAQLPHGTVLDYLKEVLWNCESLRADGFQAYADKKLLREVKAAAAQDEYSPDPLPELFDSEATSSVPEFEPPYTIEPIGRC
jgi:hypothetical protein